MTHITIYTSMKLYPKCHPYWNVDGEEVKNPNVRPVAYTAQGYLLPCCWCDHVTSDRKRHIEMFGLFDEQLKVENVDDIERDIFQSPEWYHFHDTLVQKPHLAPFICKHKCSKP